MDQIEAFHLFATAVAKALNEGKVTPVAMELCAVMVVVGDPLNGFEPYGGALNYVDGIWTVATQIEPAARIEE